MTILQLQQAVTTADAGSMNEAARRLYLSQPSLSSAIRSLEKEVGMQIFVRSNRGISLTAEGEEFISYARQVIERYRLLESRFVDKKIRKVFSVSAQHYSFAVQAFVDMVRELGMEDYEFAMHETRTREVVENVRSGRSELGVLYLSDFNEQAMTKIITDAGLEFHELVECDTCVYLWKGHPLARKKSIAMSELDPYPCLAFEQGSHDSFYLAEEMKSTWNYRKLIRADDRATMLNLMVGLLGFTLCSGMISEELNGSAYCAVPLQESEKMRIGEIHRRGVHLSPMGELYLKKLRQCAGTEEKRH